jgi:hypothetical protein
MTGTLPKTRRVRGVRSLTGRVEHAQKGSDLWRNGVTPTTAGHLRVLQPARDEKDTLPGYLRFAQPDSSRNTYLLSSGNKQD